MKKIVEYKLPKHEKIKKLQSNILDYAQQNRENISQTINSYVLEQIKVSHQEINALGLEKFVLEKLGVLESVVKGELINLLMTNNETSIIEKAAQLLQIQLILSAPKIQEIYLKRIKEEINNKLKTK